MDRTSAPQAKPGSAGAPRSSVARATPHSILVQRFVSDEAAPSVDDPSGLVRDVLASPSRPLDPETRAFMESRFGHDFANVSVHADPSSAASAQALNARAFTVGDHIVFGAGQYAPDTTGGRRILAHELSHVVQQRAGTVDAAPGPEGLRISDPADRSERAAEKVADAVMAPAPRAGAVTHPRPSTVVAAPGRTPGGPVIQRFLAGEEGHGGIDEAALEAAGFSKAEAKLAYYGNWLRDFSQLLEPDKPAHGSMWMVVRVLTAGLFGREPTEKEVGRYLPSEHVDNPAGGESTENPAITGARHEEMVKNLAPDQQAWVKDEQAHTKDIEAAARVSGLPDYIERAKLHAKRKIGEAVALGRNPEGLLALGNALHQVEDYFAHSNFVEVALAEKGVVSADNKLLATAHHYPGIDPTNIGKGDSLGRPMIVTGTSAKGVGDTVGKWEVFKSDLRSGELTSIFLRGLVVLYGASALTLGWKAGRWAGRYVGGAVGGAVGGVVGGVFGALRGLWEGGAHGHGLFGRLKGAVSGLFGGAWKGASAGAKSGWEHGGQVGAAVGGVVGEVGYLGALGLGALTAARFLWDHKLALLALGAPFLYAVDRGVQWLLKRSIKKKALESIAEAKEKNIDVDKKGNPMPTHSQIAKDDPDHPLHNAAAWLAYTADKDIGERMIAAWGAAGSPEKRAEPVQKLVDHYMAHPEAGDWWKPVLQASAGSNPPKVPAP